MLDTVEADRQLCLALIQDKWNGKVYIKVTHEISYDSGRSNFWSRIYDAWELLQIDSYELGYVIHLIKMALQSNGHVDTYGSIKYSFQDCDGWYSIAEVGGIITEIPTIDLYITTEYY